MKLRIEYTPVFKAAAKNETRYSINGALLLRDGTTSHMVATDGRMLAVMPVKCEESEDAPHRMLVPPLFDESRVAEQRRCCECDCGECADGTTPVWATLENSGYWHTHYDDATVGALPKDGKFPDHESVIPNATDETVWACLNPQLLHKLADALNERGVYLGFNGDNKSIIVMGHDNTDGGFGVLMPMTAYAKPDELVKRWSERTSAHVELCKKATGASS